MRRDNKYFALIWKCITREWKNYIFYLAVLAIDSVLFVLNYYGEWFFILIQMWILEKEKHKGTKRLNLLSFPQIQFAMS